MKAYGRVDVQIHIFLTSALAGGEWSASRPGRITPGEKAPGTHWIEGLVDPRAGLNDLEKRKFLTLSGLELRPLTRKARSQSLYRLCYPGSYLSLVLKSLLWSCQNSFRQSVLSNFNLNFLTEMFPLLFDLYFCMTLLTNNNNNNNNNKTNRNYSALFHISVGFFPFIDF
jgi:hypothetical protein